MQIPLFPPQPCKIIKHKLIYITLIIMLKNRASGQSIKNNDIYLGLIIGRIFITFSLNLNDIRS